MRDNTPIVFAVLLAMLAIAFVILDFSHTKENNNLRQQIEVMKKCQKE